MIQTGIEGLGLTMVAGILSGNCMLPAKFVRMWKWENLWLVFSLVSLLILPWVLGFVEVHALLTVYRSLPPEAFVGPMLLGAGWGVAQILFGTSVRRLGLCLGYAIIIGLGAVFGTLIPLFFGEKVLPRGTMLFEILCGVAVMGFGIALTAWGGQVRDLVERTVLPGPEQSSRYTAAILLAVFCGLLAPMLNYAFVFGHGLAAAAVRTGSSPLAAGYAVWPIALLGGLIPNLGYSCYLLRRNRSWALFSSGGSDVLWPSLMGGLWMGAFALYGVSSVLLGPLGMSVGWGLLQIFMIIAATISGLVTREWKHAPGRALTLLCAGLLALVLATMLLSAGNRQ